MLDTAAARLNMVEGQLRTNGITEPALLDAFLAIPRDRFVPEALRDSAYVDADIPLGGGRYLIEPLVFGRLIQLAEVRARDRVLLVGAGTGYGAALLARLGASVVALESDTRLAGAASRSLAELRIAGVKVVEGPLPRGYDAEAPYDALIFEGAVADVSAELAGQLSEGGRAAAVLKPGAAVGQATAMTRIGSVLSRRPYFDAAAPVLPGFEAAPGFVF
jgi:protein-L-isoaspartate(D-aspartate) O-methyltransferase